MKILLSKNFIMIALVLSALLLLWKLTESDYLRKTNATPSSSKVIILDAGHGGIDPGTSSKTGARESDINLAIVKKLKAYLESSGSYVILTRNTEKALSDGKKEDMKLRKEFIDNAKGMITISIHQNSFPDSKYKGAQVFYPEGDDESKKLATMLQKNLKKNLDPENNRVAKEAQYYILDNIKLPTVICECGFLSNDIDAANLTSEKYQELVAWSIFLGINEYFENKKDTNQETTNDNGSTNETNNETNNESPKEKNKTSNDNKMKETFSQNVI